MDQICPILCDNWETESHKDPVPFQNSFGMAKSVKIFIENLSFFQWYATNLATFSEWIGHWKAVFGPFCIHLYWLDQKTTIHHVY